MQRPVDEVCDVIIELEILGLNIKFKANCIYVDMYFDEPSTLHSQPKMSKFIIFNGKKYPL